MYYNKQDWKLVAFEKSKKKYKKYSAILFNIYTDRSVRVDFGDLRYSHYKDRVHLGLYKHLDNNDLERKRLFRARHKGFLKKGYFSPVFFYPRMAHEAWGGRLRRSAGSRGE